MSIKQNHSNNDYYASLDLISRYVTAIQDNDAANMNELRAADYVLDRVAGDAFEDSKLTEAEARAFWPSWFSAFSEFDYEVIRTIATEAVVVTEWRFIGTNTGKLESNIFGREVAPTHKTIQFRGVSIYEIDNNCIHQETLYMDLATLWVELGVGV